MKYSFLLCLILFFSCTRQSKIEEHYTDYLGEKAPGDIPIVFAKDIVSVNNRFEMGFAMSPDGRSIAFGVAHESKPEETCIYLINYNDGQWTAPGKAFLADNVNTFFPMFSPTGKELYFAKATDHSGTDLYVAQYENFKATNSRPLDSIFNSSSREAGHGLSSKGVRYFTSNRDDQYQCCGDIYKSVVDSNGQVNVLKVKELNSTADEESLYLSPNEDYIIIQAWKTEYDTKHDLYISYRDKSGLWSTPERLGKDINSKEIEQRPFVSADNKFLFFNRMVVAQVNGEDHYESDQYWVSTKSVFKPYVYNKEFDIGLVENKPFDINLPADLFRDVDGTDLTYRALLASDDELPAWITFNSSDLSLSGTWKANAPLEIKIIATDEFGNEGNYSFELPK